MKINLAFRLIVGYSLMVALLLISGLVGYNATERMSLVSDFLVNEARDTVQGALQTSNSIREQIKAVDDLLAGRSTEDVRAAQQAAQQNTDRAFNTMMDAGLLPSEQTARLNEAREAFGQTLDQLMNAHASYQQTYAQLVQNADQLKQVLNEFIELANRIIVERETNWDTDEAANSQQSEEWFAASAATEAKLALFAQLYYYQRFLANPEDEDNEALTENSLIDFDIYLEDLASMELAEEMRGEQSYAELFKDYHSRYKQLYAQARDNYLELRTQNAHYTELAQTLLQETNAIEVTSSEIINQKIQGIRGIKNDVTFSIVITVIIGVVIVLVSYFLTHKTVVTPMRKVADKLDNIAKGEGDLTQQLEVRGNDEISELSHGFNEFTGQIRQLIVQLVEVVNQLGNTANELAVQSDQTRQQMATQQSATSAVNSDMNHMSASVDEVDEAAQTADQSMRNVNDTLQHSRKVISSTLDEIHEFGAEIESATQVIEQLNQDSQQVVSVIDVIQGIAEQTNLLALNAAIEAARAGEQGRGFAVVADEVRTLASRTQQSTTEIQAIIERLQEGSEKAFSVMSSSREKATTTRESTGSASESLSEITNDIQAMDEVIRRISTAASAQNEKKASMQTNLENINNISQQTTAAGENLNQITQQLNQLATQLSSLVGRFRV